MMHRMMVFLCVTIKIASAQDWTRYLFDDRDYCSREYRALCEGKGQHVGCLYPENGPGPTCDLKHQQTFEERHKKIIVDFHNRIRSRLVAGQEKGAGGILLPRAKHMMLMQWDDELAYLAQRLADQCVFTHDQCRATLRFPHAGQNLGLVQVSNGNDSNKANAGQNVLSRAIRRVAARWYREKENADAGTLLSPFQLGAASTRYGHYAQLVKSQSGHVGCGIARLPAALLLACNYARSNMLGEPTYLEYEGGSENSSLTDLCPQNYEAAGKDYPLLCRKSESRKLYSGEKYTRFSVDEAISISPFHHLQMEDHLSQVTIPYPLHSNVETNREVNKALLPQDFEDQSLVNHNPKLYQLKPIEIMKSDADNDPNVFFGALQQNNNKVSPQLQTTEKVRYFEHPYENIIRHYDMSHGDGNLSNFRLIKDMDHFTQKPVLELVTNESTFTEEPIIISNSNYFGQHLPLHIDEKLNLQHHAAKSTKISNRENKSEGRMNKQNVFEEIRTESFHQPHKKLVHDIYSPKIIDSVHKVSSKQLSDYSSNIRENSETTSIEEEILKDSSDEYDHRAIEKEYQTSESKLPRFQNHKKLHHDLENIHPSQFNSDEVYKLEKILRKYDNGEGFSEFKELLDKNDFIKNSKKLQHHNLTTSKKNVVYSSDEQLLDKLPKSIEFIDLIPKRDNFHNSLLLSRLHNSIQNKHQKEHYSSALPEKELAKMFFGRLGSLQVSTSHWKAKLAAVERFARLQAQLHSHQDKDSANSTEIDMSKGDYSANDKHLNVKESPRFKQTPDIWISKTKHPNVVGDFMLRKNVTIPHHIQKYKKANGTKIFWEGTYKRSINRQLVKKDALSRLKKGFHEKREESEDSLDSQTRFQLPLSHNQNVPVCENNLGQGRHYEEMSEHLYGGNARGSLTAHSVKDAKNSNVHPRSAKKASSYDLESKQNQKKNGYFPDADEIQFNDAVTAFNGHRSIRVFRSAGLSSATGILINYLPIVIPLITMIVLQLPKAYG